MVRAAANERVCGVTRMVVTTYARGEGGARSVGLGRAWRTGRALGMVAGEVCMVRACGPGLGNARGWDSEWRWTVGCLLDKVGMATFLPSLLSTLGCQDALGCSPLMAMASSQWC